MLVKKEKIAEGGSTWAGRLLALLSTASLVGVWYLYFKHPEKVSATMLTTLTPMLLGLAVFGILLPFIIHQLRRLKIFGVEADLSEPIDTRPAGPSGSVSFRSGSAGGGSASR